VLAMATFRSPDRDCLPPRSARAISLPSRAPVPGERVRGDRFRLPTTRTAKRRVTERVGLRVAGRAPYPLKDSD
jgi:hypothetical protein